VRAAATELTDPTPSNRSTQRAVNGAFRRRVRAGGRALATVVALAALGSLVACSSGDDGSASSTTGFQAPEFEGNFECTDEPGDQLDGRAEGEQPGQAVPGTDLVTASVEMLDDDLLVTFTTDGPVTETDQPRFQLAKGLITEPATWFELRAFLKDGAWVVERRRLPTQLGPGGAGARESVDPLPVPVTVEVNRLSFAVPLSDLPPIDGTPTWQFGSVTAGDVEVFDDCNELGA
jgi:hypothetical protein